MHATALSPIRNLADFYQRKLNKIQGHNESFYPASSRSPKRGKNVMANNKTLVDIEQMTVLDLEKLETSPPRIQARRKNMKIVNNKAMTQFGSEAFNVNVNQGPSKEDVNVPRLSS